MAFNFDERAEELATKFETFQEYLAISSMSDLEVSMDEIIREDQGGLKEEVKAILQALREHYRDESSDIDELEFRLFDYSFTIYKLRLHRMFERDAETRDYLLGHSHLLFELFRHFVKGTDYKEDADLMDNLRELYEREEERGRQEARGLQTPEPEGPPPLERQSSVFPVQERDDGPVNRTLFGSVADEIREAPTNILENTAAVAGDAANAIGDAANATVGAIQGLLQGQGQGNEEQEDEDFRRRLQEAQEASAELGDQQPTSQAGGNVLDTVKDTIDTVAEKTGEVVSTVADKASSMINQEESVFGALSDPFEEDDEFIPTLAGGKKKKYNKRGKKSKRKTRKSRR